MNFLEVYASKKPVFSFEFFPPRKSERLPDVLDRLREFRDLGPDFMTVTYGAGGSTRSLTREMTSFIARELKLPAVAHLTCVGHSVSEIDEILDNFCASGIKHILALRGDPPKGVKDFTPHPKGFHCARDLARHIKARGDFSISVAGYPETHPDAKSREDDISYLKEKVEVGGEVVITQLFFEPGVYLDFVRRAREAGIVAPIVPGIMPVSSVAQLRRITELCGASIPKGIEQDLTKLDNDSEGLIEYGVDQATKLSLALLEGGAPGIHFYTLNKSVQVEQVLTRLKSVSSRHP